MYHPVSAIDSTLAADGHAQSLLEGRCRRRIVVQYDCEGLPELDFDRWINNWDP
jgi:hypothetical protein